MIRDRRADCPLTRVTHGERAHFFGYYDVSAWDPTGRRLLAHQAEHAARMPTPDECAAIGVIDGRRGGWNPVAWTRAWNWQTGSSLRWLDPTRIIFNDRRDDAFCAVVLDVDSGDERVLSRPVCAVHPAISVAASLDFARLAQARPVLGYAGGDPVDLSLIPEDDGLWLLDLATGDAALALSLADCAALAPGPDFATALMAPTYAGRAGFEQPSVGHRISGAQFSPSGRLLLVSHHWPRRHPLDLPHFQRHVWDRQIIYDRQTGERWLLGPDGFYSHHVWLDDTTLLMWGQVADTIGLWRMDVCGRYAPERLLAEVVREDPHASVSPDGRWLLGDGYPDEGLRPLWLCDLATGDRHDLGRFASPAPFDRGPLRCDLHPRWNPDGTAACFDSVHDGVRHLYVIDVGAVVG